MSFPLILAQVIFAIAAILFIVQGFTARNTKAWRIVNKIVIGFTTAALPLSLALVIYHLVKTY